MASQVKGITKLERENWKLILFILLVALLLTIAFFATIVPQIWDYLSSPKSVSASPLLAIGFFPKGHPKKWSWIDWVYAVMGVIFLIIAFACVASFIFSIAPL